MSGAGEGKYPINGVKVYLHEKGKSNARVTHIDIESDELAKIIKDGEATYTAGKPGGIFIGLKKDMIGRAENLLHKKKGLKDNRG
ncbi:MAG: hypothetical protein ABIH63_00610 [archaeon]